jgi:transketolase
MKDTIAVIGSVNLDILVRTQSMPERGETISGDEVYFLPGGKGANQAVSIARLGKKVNFIAKTGSDAVPGDPLKNLNHPNINLQYMIRDKKLNTGIAMVNTTGKKGNKVTWYTGANGELSPEDIEKAEEAIIGSSMVLVCTELPLKTVKKAVELARKNNKKTIISVGALTGKKREDVMSLLQGCYLIVMNEKEGGYLSNRVISHMETGNLTGKELLARGVENVIITMGREALLVNAKGAEVFPGYGVKVVDTIGGGDAFAGALAVALLEGKTIQDAVEYANASGAMNSTSTGAQEGMPGRAELDKFFGSRSGMGGHYRDYNDTIKMLEKRTNKMRVNIIKMLGCARSGHPGGSLSAIDVVSTLYLHTMNVDPKNPKMEGRDKFVLSKGHGAPALYTALAEAGFFPEEKLWQLRKIGGGLSGHPDMKKTPGVDMTTGSLGQGLSVANGMAMAAKLKGLPTRVYVMMGDGEMQEGQIWEAAMTSYHRRLDNVCAILDYNGLQIDGSIGEVKSGLEPLVEKWKAFNWNVIEIDGHNYEQIIEAFDAAKEVKGLPSIVIARTVKGKGISFMERKVEYHGVAPTPDEESRALKELGCGE